MWMIYTFILLLIMTSIRFSKYHEDYLSPNRCNAIKGIFILLVFVRHIREYIADLEMPIGYLDRVTLFIDGNLGQLIVALFLFYSGYGLMESYKRKGNEYVKSMPRRRLLPTLINFDVAVMVFFILSLFIGTSYDKKTILLSFIAWESVGNSNWYIFVILVCYFIFYIVNKPINKENKNRSVSFILLFLFVFGAGLSFVKPEWWYNTLLCFLGGVFFSGFVKDRVHLIVKYYWAILPLMSLILVVLFLIPWDYCSIKYNIFSCIFAYWTVLLTMKIQVRNKLLMWMGHNLFPLYIYQRLPMLLLYTYGTSYLISNTVVFTSVALIATIGMTLIYPFLDVNKLFNKFVNNK